MISDSDDKCSVAAKHCSKSVAVKWIFLGVLGLVLCDFTLVSVKVVNKTFKP